MADRIIGMREALRGNLENLVSPLSWNHVTDQIGMFCYSGMTPDHRSKIKRNCQFHKLPISQRFRFQKSRRRNLYVCLKHLPD
jgi:aspartate/tyrosine/aromatic aminotransferase